MVVFYIAFTSFSADGYKLPTPKAGQKQAVSAARFPAPGADHLA